MQVGGILLLLPTLGLAGYAWFALGWDGGTDRVRGDYLVLGLATVMGVGAVGMIARQAWAAWLGLGALGVLAMLITAAPLLR